MSRRIDIICEIGHNHNGDMGLAKEMIKVAANAGVDIIKFQLVDQRKRKDINKHKWKDVLINSILTRRQVFDLKAECDRYNVDFLASVFEADKVKWCEDIGMKAYKIASKSIYDVELAKAIVATDKPVIMSYGMIEEKFPAIISEWFSGTKRAKEIQLTKLYCVSKYPADLEDLHFMFDKGRQLNYGDMLITIPVSYSIFDHEYQGYSDHTIGLAACKTAMSLGSRVIEKHFTLDKSMDGPDHIHSCIPSELSDLCQYRDEVERILY